RLGEPGGRTRYLDTVRPDGDRGVIIAGNGGVGGISFVGGLRVRSRGGSVRVIGSTVVVDGADEALLMVGGATSFYHRDPETALRQDLDRAFVLNADVLLARHVDDYQRFFDRLQFRLDGEDLSAVPTD